MEIGKPLRGLKVVELKEWLQRRGIKTSGKRKADLIKSVQECLNSATNPSIYATPLTQLPQVAQTSSVYHGKLVDNPDVIPLKVYWII